MLGGEGRLVDDEKEVLFAAIIEDGEVFAVLVMGKLSRENGMVRKKVSMLSFECMSADAMNTGN